MGCLLKCPPAHPLVILPARHSTPSRPCGSSSNSVPRNKDFQWAPEYLFFLGLTHPRMHPATCASQGQWKNQKLHLNRTRFHLMKWDYWAAIVHSLFHRPLICAPVIMQTWAGISWGTLGGAGKRRGAFLKKSGWGGASLSGCWSLQWAPTKMKTTIKEKENLLYLNILILFLP